jgi:uncharacterized protein (TIGR03086 family)
MELTDGLDQAFDHAHKVIGGIRSDQLSDPTPCSEWDVRALLAHTIGVVTNIGARAAGETPAGPPDDFELGDDPALQFRTAADATLAAWRAPGALDRSLEWGAGPTPGRVLAGINLIDTATHTWDLAQATGQDPAVDESCAQLALDAARVTIVDEIRPGRFGPAVAVPADARVLDQLVAFLGRQP